MSIKLLPILLLAGCTATTQLVPVVDTRPVVSIPTATPVVMNQVQIKVMNLDDLKAAVASGQTDPLFVLDSVNYQNLSLNLVEIKRYIDEQGAIIVMLSAIVNPTPPLTPASTNNPSALTKPK